MPTRHKLPLLIIFLLLPCLLGAKVTLGIDGEDATSVGIYVKDLRTGKVVAANDEKRAILPASVMKLVTAASALYSLGDNFQFVTPVYFYGEKSDSGEWKGNLVIKSCGDPSIDSELFKERTPMSAEITNALKEQGCKKISGRIIIEEPLLQPGCIPEWEISDVPYAYGAGLFGFNYRDNYFTLWPATGETKPYAPDLELTVLKGDSGTDLERGIMSENLVVYGVNPANPKWKTQVSMNNPAAVFTAELLSALKTGGIEVLGDEVEHGTERTLVVEHKSAKSIELLRKMMHESHNLYAEAFLRALAPGDSRDAAIKAEKRQLSQLGISAEWNKICDGSGLARADRLQPIFVARVLEAASKGTKGKEYVSLFPRVGKDGTVKGLLEKTSLKGKLAMKSGSMGGVQCYAGYKLDANGSPTHVVVIMVNSFFCQRAELRGAIEKFLLNTFQ